MFLRRLALLVACVATVACQPKIGDDCVSDVDCSSVGDRVCDSTQPGGYCTVFNCDPTSCPEDESVCVAFGDARSVVAGCQNPGKTSPYVRNFCMATCDDDDDCRRDYVCFDMAEENPWSAVVIQRKSKSTKVCVAPYSGAPIPDDRDNGVCVGNEEPFEGVPEPAVGQGSPVGTGGTSPSGSGGTSSGGAGGMSLGGAAGMSGG